MSDTKSPVPLISPKPTKTEKEILTEKVQAVELHYGGISNIPIDHEYWSWVNQLRAAPKFVG